MKKNKILFYSKPVKRFYSKPITRDYNDNYTHKIKSIYYKIVSHILLMLEKIRRSLAYAALGWNSYDFDFVYIYKMLEFKLRRLKRCLIMSHLVQTQDILDALSEAIDICSRLSKDEYYNKYNKMHSKKWGKLKTIFHPEPNFSEKGLTRIEFMRSKAKTAKQKRQERQESRNNLIQSEIDRDNDLKRLFYLFTKYERQWWD